MSDTLPALNQRLDALIHALAQEFAQNEHQIGKIQSDVLGLIDDSLATGSAHTWSIDKILLSIKQAVAGIQPGTPFDPTTINAQLAALQAMTIGENSNIAASVRTDIHQTFTVDQQTQALANIGADSSLTVSAKIASAISAIAPVVVFQDVDLAAQFTMAKAAASAPA